MHHEVDPRQLVSDIKSRWRHDGAPNAETSMAQHPALARHRTLALELAYEEFCLRVEAGDTVDVHQFCDRFGSISRSLLRRIEVHQYFTEHPELLASEQRVSWPATGETFAGFHVLEQLGRGAMARVYLCSEPEVGNRQVVCKVAHQGAYEADTLGRLKHPNIVPIHSVVEDKTSQTSCICMPFCGRSTLCDLLDLAFADNRSPTRARVILDAARQHQEPNDRYDRVVDTDLRLRSAPYVDGVLILGVQLAEALRHAHEQWIFHGDLKPSNILLTPGGRPMVLDFNLAQDGHNPAAVTGGTLAYMAPEQIRANYLELSPDGNELDERSDIYALATILYELLFGQLPFGPITEQPIAGRGLARKRLELQRQGPRPALRRTPGINPSLIADLHRCLAFERAARPQSMSDVSRTLRRHLSVGPRTHRWVRMHRRAMLAGTLGLALTGGAAGVIAYRRDLYPERECQRGVARLRQGRLDEAQACFTRAIKYDPEFGEAYYWRGRTHLRREQYERALKDFRQSAANRRDGRDDACQGYCINRLEGRTEESQQRAIQCYRNALVKGFESAGLYNNLAYNYFWLRHHRSAGQNMGNLSIARDFADRAVVMEHPSAVIFFHRAWLELQSVCWDLQQEPQYAYYPETGIEDIERAIKQLPPNAEIFATAAQLCGFAATSDRRYAQSCMDYLQAAVREGYDLGRDGFLPAFDCVRETDSFQLLLKQRPGKKPGPPIDFLIDPIDESF